MSHRGEGSVYQDKPPPSKKMSGPPGSGPSKPPTEKVLFLTRDITKNENVLEKTARLVVTLHHHCANCNLVNGVLEGQFCDQVCTDGASASS